MRSQLRSTKWLKYLKERSFFSFTLWFWQTKQQHLTLDISQNEVTILSPPSLWKFGRWNGFKGRWRGRSNRRPIVRGKGAITEALWGKHWGMQQDLDNNRAPISFVPDRPECQSKLKPHTFLGFYTPLTNSLGHSAFWWDFSVTFTGELHLTSSKLLTCLTAQCFTTL